jgi:chemotaxis family two-component system response regulator Rcp1
MNNKSQHEPIEILLVEDSPGDVRLMQEALNDARVANNLNVVRDGQEAMQYLRREKAFADATTPDLILLDLNLPRKDGRTVLLEIKSDDDLKRIPVIILTTSDAEADVLKSYNLHANCYLVKPVNIDRFFELVRSLHGFWLSVVKYSSREDERCAAA